MTDLAWIVVILATMAACSSTTSEDCTSAGEDYASLCTADEGSANATANGQSAALSCESYLEAGTRDQPKAWVDCMADASTCDAAVACADEL